MDTKMQPSVFTTGPQNSLQAEKSLQRMSKKKKILVAANHLIAEKGIKGATITEIAKKAEITDSIIYHYFKNKQDLIFSLLDMHLKNDLEGLMFHFKGIMGPVSKLGKIVWYHLYQNDRGHTQVRKNLLSHCRAHPDFRKQACYKSLKKYIFEMDNLLQSGIDKGEFCPDIMIPVVRTVIFGFLDEEALLSKTFDGADGSSYVFTNIMSLVLGMIEQGPSSSASIRKPDKYEMILQTAKSLFAQKGYDQATMAEVARKAGVAEGTIYEYFKNKQDLLLSITKKYFGENKTKLDYTFAISNPIEKLQRLMWHHFAIFAADRDLVTVFLKHTKYNKDFYGDKAHEMYFHYHDKMCDVVDEGKAAGVFRAEIDTRVFRNLLMGALSNLYVRWYYRDPIHALDYMEELNHFIDLICRTAALRPTVQSRP